MSNCTSCKKKSNSDIYYDSIDSGKEKINILKKIWHVFLKVLIFLFLCAIILPIIIPVTIYTLAITVISDKGINLVPLMVYIGKKLFKDDEEEDDEDDDDEDDEELSDELYELENPHDITTLN